MRHPGNGGSTVSCLASGHPARTGSPRAWVSRPARSRSPLRGALRLGLGLVLWSVGFSAAGPLGVGPFRGAAVRAQETLPARPLPAPVRPPVGYQRALERGWREADGSPGPGYWQQETHYELRATLFPETARLDGSARIHYVNRAPARLGSIFLHLHQNLYREGSPRSEVEEVTGGVTLRRIVADGEELTERPLREGAGYRVEGTLLELRPPAPLEQGDSLTLEIDWEVILPQHGSGRMGHSDHEVYLVAYWFPKVAVFDDLSGWDAQPYLGAAEFYDGFGDYEAALTVPVGWSVMATGALENPSEVYSALTLERLAEAERSDETVVIAGQPERDAEIVTAESPDGWLTYRFRAEKVRDFAWTTSNVQRWDAASAEVPDRDGDGVSDRVLVHSFWREDRAPLWKDQARFAKQSVEHHSRYTGLTYPWPHMTSVEGDEIIDGGMEFPMLTLIGPFAGAQPQSLFDVTSHEIGHMWVPMIVGTNEKRYAWMDEGSTTFLENQSRMEFWPGVDHHRTEARPYLQVASLGMEQSMMRHGDYYEPGPGYGIASYVKPATLMVALRQILGEERWEEAYRAFLSEWAYKHPTPWDFFSTFERFAGRDLDWFWSSLYYETWTFDLAVAGVSSEGGKTRIVIRDEGFVPLPAVVRIRTQDGETVEREIPVEHWLRGNTTYELEVEVGSVARVEVDPSGYAPDIDRADNLWPR